MKEMKPSTPPQARVSIAEDIYKGLIQWLGMQPYAHVKNLIEDLLQDAKPIEPPEKPPVEPVK